MQVKNKKYLVIAILIIILIVALVLIVKISIKKPAYVEFTTKRPVRGNLEASIVIVEWSDFKSPVCIAAYPLIEEVYNKYQSQAKFEYRHFPSAKDRLAYQAAEASECAQDQGKFWEFYHLLYQNQDNLGWKDLQKYAGEISLDLEMFNDCLVSHAKAKRVDEDLKEAALLDLSFTPSIFVNGQLVSNWQNLPSLVQSLVEPAMLKNNGQTVASSLKQ